MRAQSTSGVAARLRASFFRAVLVLLAIVTSACMTPERSAGTVVFASGADLESANPLVTIHPLSKQVQRHVLFLTLMRFDEKMQPQLYLASAWWMSDDKREIGFRIRDVPWHDGRPTTAADVAWTIESARNPRSRFPRAADLSGVTGVTAADDSTVRIRFATPQAGIPNILCELPILPAHLLRDVAIDSMRTAPFNDKPVGNGPFRFVQRVAGRRWVFERNDNFPASLGGPPLIERLVIAVVDEATTKFAGLVSGELDVAGISPVMAELAGRDARLRVLSYPLLLTNGIIFNVHRPPFDDVRVRRALAHSVNRERLVTVALAGFGVPSGSAVVPDNPLSFGVGPKLDAPLADSLLDATGWVRGADGTRRKDGKALTFELLTVVTANNELEQLIQADLSERGIQMQIRGVEFATFLARARERPKKFDALITGIPGDLSLSYLVSMFDSSLAGSALDYADYHTPRLDSLFRRVRAAPDHLAIAWAWGAVQTELAAQVPAAWLYHSRGVQGLSRRLTGVEMDLRGELATISRWNTDGGNKQPQ